MMSKSSRFQIEKGFDFMQVNHPYKEKNDMC